MWLGTSGKGLTFVSQDGLEMKTYNTSNSPISSNRIMSLLYDDGRLLIGTQGNGLDILTEGKNWQHFNVTSNPSLNAKTIWTIKKNKEGFWLGSRDNGLILFDIMNGTIEEFNNNLSTENSIISNNIRAIEEDKGGNIWIASSDRGLCSFNRNTRRFSYYNNIPDELKSLYYDEKRDILWIGTNGYGLYEFKPNTGEVNATYTLENESLLNNVVYGILEDDENHLWLSSNKGLTEFDLDNHTTKHYNRFDGLQGLEFNTGAYFQHANGTLYFGGLNGINWFKPNQIETNPNAPNTVITDLQINGNSYPIEKHHQFEPSNNTLTFTFSALHFSQPQRNNYMYLLEGYDEDWTLSGFGNRAHYTKLPPGDYTFKVKSSNYDGVWGEEITTFPFSIKKPWYISNLAIASYLLLFGILIWLLLNYLRWRWKIQMQLKAEHQQAEYFKELNEIKTKLYTNISHEIRTPLTLIRGPVINQLNRKDLSKKDQKELALLNRNTERLMDLVNQMNDLSRIDSGQMKVVETKGDLSNFLKQIIQGFEYKAKEKDITIQHNLQAIPPALFDPDILEKIISNLLSNAVKYAPINSIVKISADLINSNMVLSIVNSNSQVNVKNLNRMFDRFYQNDHKSEGMGVGLALVKELVELCQGQIIANNLQEDKIQFTVTLPLKIEKIHETSVNEKININSKDTIDELTKLKPSILIVEDNVEIRKFLVSILTTDYKIFEADNGEKGFLMATEKLPDLIISDIMMPIMDGREFCKKIKSNSTTSTIPVILLTAISGSKNEVKGLEDGADGYVTKPFNPQKLLLTIENMLKSVSKLKDRYAHNIITNKGIETYKIEEKFLDDLKSVLDKNLIDPNFTADKFCRLMGMSRTQLHRKLKSIAGFSTTEFIRKQRLQLGEVLLRESDATVSEIAYQLGFNSSSYFIKCFKKDYNCTPDEYRNSA